MLKKIIILLLLSINTYVSSQVKHQLGLFGTPLMKNLNDPNKRGTILSNENVKLNFYSPPYYEIGVDYTLNFKNNLGLRFGSSWKHRKLGFNYSLLRPASSIDQLPINSVDRNVKINYASIRIGLLYTFRDRYFFELLAGIYAPVKITSDGPYTSIQSIGSSVDGFVVDERIYAADGLFKKYIVPEINFGYRIYKGLSVYTGLKAKFWSKDQFFLIEGFGYFDNNGTISDPLYKYSFRDTELSFQLGLRYNFSFDSDD